MSSTDHTAPVIDYAAVPPDQTRPAVLRRLAVLNAVAGVAMLLVIPGFVAAGYVMLRNDPSPYIVKPVTLGSMWHGVLPNLPRLLPQIVYLLACAAAALASAVLIGRRRGRAVCIVAAFAMCLCIPVGTAAGLPTAIILMRRRTAAAYAAGW